MPTPKPTSGSGPPELERIYESKIVEYYDACNSGDVERIASCFTSDAVHYFPAGVYGGPFVGARSIAERWSYAVREWGSSWAIDSLLVDGERDMAVLEWTHHKAKQSVILRGTEWVVFEAESAAIREIRAYYAAPQPVEGGVFELGGFDYAGRSYHEPGASVPSPPGDAARQIGEGD